jgi:hypothetical protein
MKIANLINLGPLAYTHYYMDGSAQCDHILAVPTQLITLTSDVDGQQWRGDELVAASNKKARFAADAEVVEYTDQHLAIEIDGKMWAHDDPKNASFYGSGNQKIRSFPSEVWLYLRLAIDKVRAAA